MDKYSEFFNEIVNFINKDRVITNELLLRALSVDASCYDYTPKIIIKAQNEDEILKILEFSNKFEIPITFRAAGSSLSGQSSSDSVLVIANDGWKNIHINDDISIIECDCGVIGQKANDALIKHGKKIGPDPATIATALIGGIFNNNSSGMCCGVAGNSYNTIHSVRAILLDGTIIDTNDEKSVENFLENKKELCAGLLGLRDEILGDESLKEMIFRKFKIKNTTGYSINALLEFCQIKDILNHILIGAEGTLAFISKVRYFTQIDKALKVCALLFYKDLGQASDAVVRLNKLGGIVSSAEMMDGSCLKALKTLENMPEILYQSDDDEICLLIQSEANDENALNLQLNTIKSEIESTKPQKALYSFDKKEQDEWWKLRKSILPIVAGIRKLGSTVITEDVCFKIDDFIAGSAMIKGLFSKYNFNDGVIFGHALSGNLHFNITPDLSDKGELARFSQLVKDLCEQMAKFDGSMKAEHGTGRMVAPFVELEWGQKAYEINKKIKALFDPKGLLNPDVIITNNPDIYKEKLKVTPNFLSPIPEYSDIINKCMECGYCEKVCPSKDLTLTPRARIGILRYIANLIKNGDKIKAGELLKEYEYFGIKTCARCSSCATLCPLGIDTAKIADELRCELKERSFIKFTDNFVAKNMDMLCYMARFGISTYHFFAKFFGAKNLSALSAKIHSHINCLPFVPEKLPSANYYKLENKNEFDEKIVYFTACTNRMFKGAVPLQASVESLCKKAKISVIYPKNIAKMCCGKIYDDNKKLFNENLNFLRRELDNATNGGKIKVVVDHSSCYYTLLKNLDGFEILDISEFLLEIAPRLEIVKSHEKILVHQLCLLKKLGKAHNIVTLAKMLSDDVEVIKSFECCGFAGNNGFSTPELNQSSTRFLKYESANFTKGVSSSSTCQIGLNSYGNIEFTSIAALLDEHSR